MGEQKTNPVLQAIDNSPEIEQEKKYPEGLLQFKDKNWQAFYHCHSTAKDIQHLFETEHGHFHIFVKVSEQPVKWSHVVALSMDELGQPLRWFMVNHWVSGETWLESNLFDDLLKYIPYKDQDSVLAQWLMVMLDLYKPEIKELLKKRDAALSGLDSEQCLKDRALYLLAEKNINLKEKFASQNFV